MKKLKRIINYCFMFIAAVFGCVVFSGATALDISQEVSKAATPISLYANLRERSNGVTVTNPEVKITDWIANASTRQIVLALTHDNFNYYSNETVFAGDELDAPSSGTTLIHQSGLISNVTSSDTANVTKNGQFVTAISLPVSMQNAILNGAVSIDSSATLITKWMGNVLWWSDSPEKIIMEMTAYNDAFSEGTSTQKYEFASSLSGSSFKNKTVSDDASLSLSKSALAGFESLDFLSLSFKSEINGDCYNYMQINNPVVKFSTDDITKPTISYNSDELSTGWVGTSKVLKIATSDAYSGISAVYVNGVEVDATFSNNTKNASYNYTIEANGTYEIKVVDNVGNTETITYTESKIDKMKPSATIEISEIFTSKYITFSASIIPSTLSTDTFTVNYTATELFGQDMKDVSASIEFISGENTIALAENGKYTLIFSGIDEVGNVMQDIVAYIEVDDRTIVTLDIEQNYIYNPAGFSPLYTASESGDYAVSFNYYTEDDNSISSINNIGNYVVEYVIDAYLYKGTGTQSVVVSPREIVISNVKNEYTYTGEELEISFAQSEIAVLSIKYYQNDTETSFKNAGDYVCKIAPVSANYYITDGNYNLKVNKQQLTISNIKSSFVYDKTAKSIDFDVSNIEQKSNFAVSYYSPEKTVVSNSQVVNAGNYYAVIEFVGDTLNYAYDAYTTLETALEFNIAKRDIEVNVVSQNLVYGDELGELEYNLVNALNSEPLEFSLSTNYNRNVGTYAITIDQKYALTEAEAELLKNYSVTYSEGTIVVSPKSIVLVPTQKQSKIYGEVDTALTYTTDGLVYSDVLEGQLSREEGENVGYYNITIGTVGNPNYRITLSSERFEIVKRMAFVFIYNSEKTYGETDPEFSFNTSASNFTTSDLEALEYFELFVRENGENVGSYNISVNKDILESNQMFDNYNVLYIGARFTINKAVVYAEAEDKIVNFGDEEELTYVFTNKTIADDVSLELSREEGLNVGEYQINCHSTSFSNYDIVFMPAVYKIVPRNITIKVISGTKTYGEPDNIGYNVTNAVSDIDIKLFRNQGENVGEYLVNSFEMNDVNYRVVEFYTDWYEIVPAKLVVTIADAEKVYGESDPEFTCTISGVGFNEELDLQIVREAGENAGEYALSCENTAFDNYVIEEVISGKLEIKKADMEFELPNFSVVYTGSPIELSINGFDYELDYSFTDTVGTEVDAPINAGEYVVSAYFAGNENYNPFKSNTSKLVIEKKIIPVTLKKQTFLYNGKSQAPEYDINLDTPVSVIVEYNGVSEPIEVGEYEFRIISNNPNCVCTYSSKLYIVNEFYSEDASGDASMSTSNVNFASSGVQIQKNSNSKYMSMFSPVFDGRKCLAVYEFIGSNSADDGEVFTVKIKATGNKENIQIYTLDGNGKITPVTYTYSNGYYILSVNSLTSDILVTESNNILKYAKMVAIVLVLVLSVAVTKLVNRRRKNSFFARNTSVRLLDKDYVKKNINVVYSRVNYDGNIPVKTIIKK